MKSYTASIPYALALALCASVSEASDCPGTLNTEFNAEHANATINCLNASIKQLQDEVNALKGLSKVDPIGKVTSEKLEAEVTGLGKVVKEPTSTTREEYVTASFSIKNMSTEDLYVAFDAHTGFVATDTHGIKATTRECSGMRSVGTWNSPNAFADDRSKYTVIPPSGAVSIAFTTDKLTSEPSAKLGERFMLGFSVVRYRDPSRETSKNFVSIPFRFLNITATQ